MYKHVQKLILLADSHIASEAQSKELFIFLDAVSRLDNSFGIIFLGDIFELWIALKKYENETHKRFLEWCKEEKKRRPVIFIEGNHEFYIAKTRREFFTDASDRFCRLNDLKFIHGDLINRKDRNYYLLRGALRNCFTRTLLRITGSWIGPIVAEKVRSGLKHTNREHKSFFPEYHAEKFMEKELAADEKRIFMGHFHTRRTLEKNDLRAEVLPDATDKLITAVYDIEKDSFELAPWREHAVFNERKDS